MPGRVIQGFFIGGAPRAPVLAARPVKASPAPGRPPLAHQPGQVAQRSGGGNSFEIDPAAVGLARGGGTPLPQALRARMEAALRADFSAVRVHVGPQAARIGAVAFTTGNDLYFAPGQFQPDSVKGQQLIGHELAHVIQQRQGRVRAPGSGVAVVQDRALEAEADRLGMRAALHPAPGQAAAAAFRRYAGPALLVQRMEDDGIGSRVGNRNKLGRIKSNRIRGNVEFTGYRPYYERKEKGCWDERSRPGFTEKTWKRLWKDDGSQVDGNGNRQYFCVKCLTWCVRKKDAPQQARALDATIDHIVDWKRYIFDNGEPNEEGKVTSEGAKDAYNATSNLQVMCRSCNAQKNGPKNVFD